MEVEVNSEMAYSNQFNSNVGFWGEGKPEYPEKNLSMQRRKATNSNHVKRRGWYRTEATLVGDECSHHYSIPAPDS